MVKSTRSRGIQNDREDLKGLARPDSPKNVRSNKRKADDSPPDVRNSPHSGSKRTNSYGLRSHVDELPSLKKIKTPSPTILRKSERFQKHALNASSDSTKSGTLECKHSASPLRRSERIGKPISSSSPSSVKSQKSSSSTETDKSKNGKTGAKLLADKSEQTNDSESTIRSAEVLKRKKRLDARSYRASFSSTQKKSKISESGRLLQKGEAALQKSIPTSEAENSGESQVGGRHHDLNMAKSTARNSALDVEDITERKVVDLIFLDDKDGNITDSNGSNKVCLNDANENENADAPDSKQRSSIQSSTFGTNIRFSVACVSKPVAEGVDSGGEGCPVAREEAGISKTNDSPSEGRLHTDDVDKQSKAEGGFPRNAEKAVDDSNISLTPPMENCGQDNSSSETPNYTGVMEERHSLPSLGKSSQASVVMKASDLCVICKHPGLLVSCSGNGCKRSYHLACIDPPLRVPCADWLCLPCIKKKLKEGVYAVSDGIESIMSVKEGTQIEREYLVKYKGLAHVHNCWVPESQILRDAPALVADFNECQNEKAIRWNPEWMEPQRLLQKRLVMPRDVAEEFFSQHDCNLVRCFSEWLVKWKGLGYEHSSWELESSPFLCSFEGSLLIKDYEERRCRAKQASDPSLAKKVLQVKNGPFHKLSTLPNGFPPGLDKDHLNSVNRLREFWHKSQSAVLLDGEEGIAKSILFILSLKSHTCQPFLVISKPSSLSLWEAEFTRLAPSVNLVVYNGTKDTRKMIQALEFYEEGGCVMFEVLLTQPDALHEDIDAIECIGWESVIVDECQDPSISNSLKFFRNIQTDFRMLLFSSRLKDDLTGYLHVLSFLEPAAKEKCSSLECDTNYNIDMLAIAKDKFAHSIAYERKTDSPCFSEFWVPAELSSLQLEQYCSTLISNSHSLRSISRVDHVDALIDIVITTRKCCDHPYLVDPSLQNSTTKGIPPEELLDVHVKASGKLQLLDKILKKMKEQGLRVVILIQSGGCAGRNQMSDVLDDFLRQRFGEDAYERVDSGLHASKKTAAVNRFNDKRRGAFVFLIESRACLPSVKLSSVDAVIIYDSDWNPLNDLKGLQKICMESPFHQIKVFRLYSAFTVEEGVLVLAKNEVILESRLQTISPTVSHSLLTWGASYLFDKLAEFHQNNNLPVTISSKASSEILVMDEVVSELLKQLQSNNEAADTTDCSILIKAAHSGTSYSRNILLVGEKKGISSVNVDIANFWTSLLENRCPQWRYVPDPLQKPRRRLFCSNELMKAPEVENKEAQKKHKKVAKGTTQPASPQSCLPDKRNKMDGTKDAKVLEIPSFPGSLNHSSLSSGRKPYAPSLTSKGLESPRSSDETEGTKQLLLVQRGLCLSLKPELAELCGALGLPDAVKEMAENFLEYVMYNHHVNVEPKAILEALEISLCWLAAAFCKHKVNRRQTLEIAKSSLNFGCSEEQAESVYSKLKERNLKKMFRQQTNISQAEASVQELEDEINCEKMNQNEAISRNLASKAQTICLPHNNQENSMDESKEKEGHQLACVEELEEGEIRPEKMNHGNQNGLDTINFVDKVLAACSGREKEVLLKQELEKAEFNKQREEEKRKLQKKMSKEEFLKILDPFDKHMNLQRNKLIGMQIAARNKERQLKDNWLKEAEAGNLAESFCDLPLPDSGFVLEKFHVGKLGGLCTSQEAMVCSQPVDQRSGTLMTSEQSNPVHTCAEPAEIPEKLPNIVENDLLPIDNSPTPPNCTSLEISHKQNNCQCPGKALHLGEECVSMDEEIRVSESRLQEDVNMISEGSANPCASANVEIESHGPLISQPLENQIESPCLPTIASTSGREISPPPNQAPMVISSEQTLPQASHTVGPYSGAQENTNEYHVPTAAEAILAHGGNMVAHIDTARAPCSQLHDLPNHQSIETLWVPAEGLHPDPLENELVRIRRQEEHIRKIHEEKVEEIRKQCAKLIQKADVEFSKEREKLNEIYRKVLINRVLAEEFRLRFIDYKGSASQGQRSSLQQYMQMQQPQYAPRPPSSLAASLISNRAQLQVSGPANLPSRDAIHRTPSACPNASVASTSASPGPLHLQAATVPVGSNIVTVRPLASPIPPGTNNSAGGDTNKRLPAPHLHYKSQRISPSVTPQAGANIQQNASSLQAETPSDAAPTVPVMSGNRNNLVSDIGVPSSEADVSARDVICVDDD